MQDLFFSPIPLERLKSELMDSIKKELHAYIQAIPPTIEQNELITRKEAAKILCISLPTLNEWTKEGKIIGYRISSRVRYKRSEIQAAVVQIKSVYNQKKTA